MKLLALSAVINIQYFGKIYVIADGYADLVAFGKLYISNPDLVGRFREDVATSDWDKDTFNTQGKEGYIDYEAKTRDLIPTAK